MHYTTVAELELGPKLVLCYKHTTKTFFLKLHCPKKRSKYETKLCPMKLGQNFVRYFVRFVGNEVSRKKCFWDLLTFRRTSFAQTFKSIFSNSKWFLIKSDTWIYVRGNFISKFGNCTERVDIPECTYFLLIFVYASIQNAMQLVS